MVREGRTMQNTLWITLLFASVLCAQESSPTAMTASEAATRLDSAQANSGQTGPVAVPEMSEKARRYYDSGNVLWFVNLIWGLLIPILFLVTGFSAKMRDWAQRLGKKWFFDHVDQSYLDRPTLQRLWPKE